MSEDHFARRDRVFAGVLLILFTAIPVFILIAFWPDRLPSPGENIRPLYRWQLFHVQLAYTEKQDSVLQSEKKGASADIPAKYIIGDSKGLIHINTIILLLVTAAGFLGNMIHIASSFTNFIGAGLFKKSWLLWYAVRPFTASALAIGIYFVFRGGFLNMSDDTSNINLYGVMTISILAGLYTDNATQKLKEVFEVLFRPKDGRPDKLPEKIATGLAANALKFSGISPEKIDVAFTNKIVISGENFDKMKLKIEVNERLVENVDIEAATINFDYFPSDQDKEKGFITIKVKDENNDLLFNKTMNF